MFHVLSSSFSSKSKYLNVHQNYPVTHCIFISLLYIWYVMKHGVPSFTSANTRRNVSFIESPKSFFVIVRPTQRCLGMGWNALFSLFFLSSQMVINSLKEIHIKCLVEDTISEWWFFFGNKKTTFMLSVVKEWLWKPVISIRTQAV